jgi:DNA repair protein RadC
MLPNTSRLGVLLDAEEEFENLLAEERRTRATAAVTDISAWGGWPERSTVRALAEPAGTWDYRSGRCNSMVRRALVPGRSHVTDRSLLDLLLYLAEPRLALNGTGARLLVRFGNLQSVLAANPRELATVQLMSRPVVDWLQRVGRAIVQAETPVEERQPLLATTNDLLGYLGPTLQRRATPSTRLLLLDQASRLRQDVAIVDNDVEAREPRPTDLLRACLESGAHDAILVSHVPAQPALPTAPALARHGQRVRALGTADITLRDHVIVGEGTFISLNAHVRPSGHGAAAQIPMPRLSAA